MERQELVELWQEAWTDGLWHAPWGKAIEDLTPQQAAWKPQPARHSIWQILNHIIFWQDYTLRSARGQKPDREAFAREQEQRNWEEPREPSDTNWALTKRTFEDSYRQMVALARNAEKPDRPLYHLMHESYHFGQMMYLRAMQGLPAIE